SLAKLAGRRTRFWRPRTVAYAAVLSTILLASTALVNLRVPFEASVTRAPGSLYTVDTDGWVRNTYLLRLANNQPDQTLSFDVSVQGLADAQVVTAPVELRPEEGRVVPLVVRLPPASASARTLPLRVRVVTGTGTRLLDTTFKTAGEGAGP